MAVEELTEKAIQITRTVLLGVLDNPLAISYMSAGRCKPEELEDNIREILEYLDKTAPEEGEG